MVEKDSPKKRAAEAALHLEEFERARVVGVGTGSTVAHFISLLRKKDIEEKLFVSSSFETAIALRRRGCSVLDISVTDSVDFYVDGADAVDENGNMIKGGGAALFREKILASMSAFFAVIVDKGKMVTNLIGRSVPVEVSPFSVAYVMKKIGEMGLRASIRHSLAGKYGPVVSDSYGIIVDVDSSGWRGNIEDLDRALRGVVGVIATGLFVGMADAVVIGGEEEAVVRRLKR
ncbi:MAG: ribose-5-phosphate isomerase RpiA [Fervidicoccaceae archaeon]